MPKNLQRKLLWAFIIFDRLVAKNFALRSYWLNLQKLHEM